MSDTFTLKITKKVPLDELPPLPKPVNKASQQKTDAIMALITQMNDPTVGYEITTDGTYSLRGLKTAINRHAKKVGKKITVWCGEDGVVYGKVEE